MKKIVQGMVFVIALVTLNNCGSVREEQVDNANYKRQHLTTWLLVDELGYAYAEVPYKCDSMYQWRTTAVNGAFSFVQADQCEFDFDGLNGRYGDAFDDIIRIVDEGHHVKNHIPYACQYFGVSSTYGDGRFDYDEDDMCTFSFE